MQTSSLPYIIPSCIEFNIRNESSLSQTICIYNPYAFDILFKVDNAKPQKYNVSNRQGLISSRQKLHLEVTCRIPELSQDQIQVRFFKWSRPPRHGQKSRAQHYIGFREVRLCVTNDYYQRERTPSSQGSDRLSMSTSSAPTGRHDHTSSNPNPGSIGSSQGSSRITRQDMDSGDTEQHRRLQDGPQFQVISNIILTIVLVLVGFLLNKANGDWFSINVMEGIKPQTLAIVAYTLAGVVIIRLLTLR